MRLFLAVPAPPCPPGAGDAYAEVTRRLAAAVPGARLVPAGTWHATLRFLADADPDEVARAAAPAVARHAAFPVEVRGVGAFPSPRRARVAWAAMQGPGLEALARGVRAALPVPEGDDRPFQAHVTLARLDPPRDLRAFLAAHADVPLGAGLLEEVRLCRSETMPDGPRYTVLATLPLQPRRP